MSVLRVLIEVSATILSDAPSLYPSILSAHKRRRGLIHKQAAVEMVAEDGGGKSR